MLLETETEYNDEYYTLEGYMNREVPSTHDYCGDPAELDYMTIYNEEGCDITNQIGWAMYEEMEQELYDLYDRVR